MKRQFILFSALLLVGLGLSGMRWLRSADDQEGKWTKDTPLSEVLEALGDPAPNHKPKNFSPEMAQKGKEIFETGVTTGPDGKKVRLQSRHFVCTNCHNTEREDPDLRVSDPDVRLDYVLENRIPFLPATTMYGTYNKRSWYNGDYLKKYGDFVRPAYNSLEYAIHLCATVCSQGRDFSDWEMQAMLSYYYTIQYTLGDLDLDNEQWQMLVDAQGKGPNPKFVEGLKGFYRSGSPATFLEAPEDKEKGYDVARAPDPARGELLYNNSCLMCHDEQGPSNYLKLDNGTLSLAMFRNHLRSKGHLSLYEIVRHGTYADNGHRAYMPNFTAERLSNQQVEDLRAYIMKGDS